MKAFMIKDGVQFSCDVEGETWRQGDDLVGRVEINDSSVDGRVLIVTGKKKKIKDKDPKAYTILESQLVSQSEADFKFSLSECFPINDIYILFGSGENLFDYGNLTLEISPSSVIIDFLDVFNLFFKFKSKGLKSNKDGLVEAKVEVPSSNEYANILSLKMLMKIDNDDLELIYDFVVNKIAYDDGDAKLVKTKMPIKRTMSPKEYLIYGDSFNQDNIKTMIFEVLEQVKTKQF